MEQMLTFYVKKSKIRYKQGGGLGNLNFWGDFWLNFGIFVKFFIGDLNFFMVF